MNLFYTCKNCKHEFSLAVTPGSPAQLYGPPESCDPGTPPEWTPDACGRCHEPVDEQFVYDRMAEEPVREHDED